MRFLCGDELLENFHDSSMFQQSLKRKVQAYFEHIGEISPIYLYTESTYTDGVVRSQRQHMLQRF